MKSNSKLSANPLDIYNDLLKNGNNSPYWFFTLGLIVPLIASILTVKLGKLPPPFPMEHPLKAVLYGSIIALFSYIIMKYIIIEKHPLKQSILIGLLCAEVMVFVHDNTNISMGLISLWLFFYFHSVEH